MHWPIVVLLTGAFQNFSISWNVKFSNDFILNTKHEHHWRNFKLTHDKQYDSLKEEHRRKDIFQENIQMINAHNDRYNHGLETFKMGVNQFSDLTSQEFKQKYLGSNIMTNDIINDESPEDTTYKQSTSDYDKVSWFKYEVQHYVSAIPVRDQGDCQCCWAFAAIALLEYEYYYSKHIVVSLSAQELLDCTGDKNRCSGGNTMDALKYILKKGIDYERDYPYKRARSSLAKRIIKCKLPWNKAPQIIREVKTIKRSEKAIYDQLKYTPLKVAIYASSEAFQHYKSGYITPAECENQIVNHAVVILGAIKENGVPLWFIRNSWGPNWGVDGHFKLLMNRNTCNMLHREAIYVVHK